MTYGIKNKVTGEFFGGFDNDAVVWVANKAYAWTSDKITARAQASLLICNGHPAQRKLV